MARKWNGMDWIRLSTRCAIYHRDGFRCVYCDAEGGSLGEGLSLDHVEAHHHGGGNHPENLVTCCLDCNKSKQHASMRAWFARLRIKGVETTNLSASIARRRRKPLDRDAGRDIACRRRPSTRRQMRA